MTAAERHRRHSFPFLSPTFSSNQLWTPLYLDRITISDPHYQEHLHRSVQSQPPHLNAVNRRVQKYGDNAFFLHKDIPVQQLYKRTFLHRSQVRPWDELVPRPLTSQDVLKKESHLPYPAQHPYTSHISQFSVFPSTSSDTRAVAMETFEDDNSSEVRTVNSYSQTEHSFFRPHEHSVPSATVVYRKAFCDGMRHEEVRNHTQSLESPITQLTNTQHKLYWQVPKTAPSRQRSRTYPAPSTMFGESDTPVCLSRPITADTHHALQSVNRRLARDTTYKDQFPSSCHVPLTSLPVSHCNTADRRGKYSRMITHTLSQSPDLESSRRVFSSLQQGETASLPKMADAATQTDEVVDPNEDTAECNDNSTEETIREERLPLLVDFRPPSIESFFYSEASGEPLSRLPSAGLPVLATNRPYSHTDAQRRFHSQHPDTLPDLRTYSVKSGRRHTFSGYNAHYWH